jgi:hypothetical protein
MPQIRHQKSKLKATYITREVSGRSIHGSLYYQWGWKCYLQRFGLLEVAESDDRLIRTHFKSGHRELKTSRTFMQDDPGFPSPFVGPLTYALGWITVVYRGHKFFVHNGGMEAFGAETIFFPTLTYGITLFGNTALTSNIR